MMVMMMMMIASRALFGIVWPHYGQYNSSDLFDEEWDPLLGARKP